ncbi:TlpA family protein disulfide reductase [Hymenobacter elongatus]|uniref:TlpA family protein disulfide reductase n=1 Tax=Hymenobacter elongatus TaxID=877208 RepID=A0A4Z0PFV7_9BACT|nr:TlpA disulfide reductase family protein [Hymenobacter elongatus]TGE13968.1 TlpA family protein disulfide reductase [Hymenobacter elongatus]
MLSLLMLLVSSLSAILLSYYTCLFPSHSICSSTTVSAPIVISGHLAHAPAGDSIRLEFGQFKVKVPITATGNFRVKLPRVAAATPASLYYARQHASLYLTPGDSLHLTLEFPRFDETLRFTGRGAAANNYLAQALWQFEYGPVGSVPRPVEQRTPQTTAAQMRAYADSFRQKRQDFLATYTQAHPVAAAFKSYATLRINLQWAISLLEYPQYYRDTNKRLAPLPNSYFNFLQQLPLKKLDECFGRDQSESTLALQFLTVYSNRLLPSGTLSSDPGEAQKLYNKATADLGLTSSRDKALYQLLSYQLDANTAGVVAAMPTFRLQNQDSVLARNLREMVSKQLRVEPGQPAPPFTLLNNDGKKVTLSDFKGKVVYLDFWGSWCAPCIAEIPASTALKERMAGREVVFISVAVGDTEEKWQRTLQAHQLTSAAGVQLRSPDNTVAAAYQIYSYPSHMLIGRDGRIRVRRAPAPSAGAETIAAIESALSK